MPDSESNINAGFGLPLEYASQLEALAQRRKLAQALQAQAAQPIQVPQYGPMASKLSPLAPLGQAVAMYLNQKNIDRAQTERTKVLGEAEAGGRQELSDVMGMSDPQAQIAAALASRYPGVRQYGTSRQKTYDDRVKAAAEGAFRGDDTRGGMRILSAGQLPVDYSLPAVPPASIERVPGGPPGQVMARTTNRKGEETIRFNALPSSVKVTQGGVTLPGQKVGFEEWAKSAVKDNQAKADAARGASELTQTLDQMLVLDKQGLVAGPAANPLLFITGLAKQAGLPVDEAKLANSSTYNALASQAVQSLVAQLGGARGFTEKETKIIEQSLPQLQQSLEARTQLTQIIRAAAQRRIKEYEQSRDNLQEALTTQDIRKYNFGPVQYPGTPLVPPATPVGATKPPELTPEEQRELEQLRRR